MRFAVRVDWFRVIVDLERSGVSMRAVSLRTEIPCETLRSWRNRYVEPSFYAGDRLVGVWCRELGRDREQLPPLRDQTLSAARAKT